MGSRWHPERSSRTDLFVCLVRMLAAFIDLALYVYLVVLPTIALLGEDRASRRFGGNLFAVLVLSPFVYASLMECAPWQGTVGKLVVGLRVVGTRRQRIGLLRSLARNGAKLLGFVPMCFVQGWGYVALLLANVIVASLYPGSPAMHDLLSGTWVVTTDELPDPLAIRKGDGAEA